MNRSAPARSRRPLLGLLLALLLAACAQVPPLQPLPHDEAAARLADVLRLQLERLPPAGGRPRRSLVLDPMIESASGQQTAATAWLGRHVAERLARQAQALEVVALDPASARDADLLLTGTLGAGPSADLLRLDAALTDARTGRVVARASALTPADGLDRTPAPAYRDSPVLLRDAATDAYVRTAAAEVGASADAGYLDRLALNALVQSAVRAYNDGDSVRALVLYRAAAAAPGGGQQVRVLSGLYLAYARLGRAAEAEQAFGKVVAAGLAQNQLALKLLFAPGRTDYWPDPKVSAPYGMWLRQIARAGASAAGCLNVVGHASATGTESANDNLSAQRAQVVRARLLREAPELAARTRSTGLGARRNIVGSGTDNAADALDRRVEFELVPCG